MADKHNRTVKMMLLMVGVIVVIIGVTETDLVVAATAVSCFALVTGRWSRFLFGRFSRQEEPAPVCEAPPQAAPTAPLAEPQDMGEYVELLLGQGRHVLLLRPQIAENLQPEQLEKAIEAWHEDMAPVPAGQVLLAQPNVEGKQDGRGHLVRVKAFYLDRHLVTNRQYKRFVDAGGYKDSALWDPSVWPGVLDFVDATGRPGPQFWHDGTYPEALADHPVVGVNWYEAQAYARWTGKRLPDDPEWVKTSSWPVSTRNDSTPQQRKYPWGNTLDADKANLWMGGSRTTVPVYDYADGVSVGGVYQLVGNVWEWTTTEFGEWHSEDCRVDSPNELKSLRGGAFDTYFDSHAVCQFQSGDSPLARKHNIGFRCHWASAT